MTPKTPKNTMCLWFDKDAQEAARFHDATFLARPQPLRGLKHRRRFQP